MSETNNRPNRRKFLQGTVVSDKMDKTRVVQVRSTKKHNRYDKITKVAVKFKAHDEKNESKLGDFVKIMETRRLSKDKRWVIREILKTGEVDSGVIE
ncbi:MAG: 30S ribosomal protein S17 [Candidatus Omnitrophica bacterium]|nr:30S ribosomal protein S17 [Candidatus Omnitrophota bacterium]MCB9747656.1 30S ribosomal protein S17 [Candidatus Omnitrophota bacterium]